MADRDSPSAKGEAAALNPGAAHQVSQTPRAIQMRRLWREQRTQREGWQEEVIWEEWLHQQQAQDFQTQVLQELHQFHHDHAVAIG
ncbi:hypothetical protein Y1Q_0009294 [Alligator mississippiensis]|uniref:Uncharacterized protein n=1 Tax=Alligator mississippiensis TaxID=8496 RepID=A0A151NGR5_ALLMI|nr:hypothetical protein Y1Q_0009294 [Alligator mississippiensis]